MSFLFVNVSLSLSSYISFFACIQTLSEKELKLLEYLMRFSDVKTVDV